MALPAAHNPVTVFPGGNAFVNITAAAPTTTAVSAAPAVLVRIVVNKAAANGTITVYDNTAASGTIAALVTMPATLLANQFVFEYGVAMSTGITVVTATAAQDITVVYRT